MPVFYWRKETNVGSNNVKITKNKKKIKTPDVFISRSEESDETKKKITLRLRIKLIGLISNRKKAAEKTRKRNKFLGNFSLTSKLIYNCKHTYTRTKQNQTSHTRALTHKNTHTHRYT